MFWRPFDILNCFCVNTKRGHVCWDELGKTRFLRGHIAPFLDNWLLDLPWVGSRPGADLLGDINALLSRGKLRDKLGHMLAGTLGLKGALFLGGILDNGLGFVVTFLSSLLESTTSRGTEFSWLFGTSSDGGVLLHILLGDRTHLLGPLGALGVGSVSRGFILTLLLNLSPALNNIILNIMNLLLGPALRFILSSANLRSLNITVLYKRGSADLNGLIESDFLVFNETVLPVVLLALLFLLRLVVGDIGGVAPLVVRVVTLHNIIILSLLNHLNFVNTFLAIRSRSSSSNGSKAHICIITTLTLGTSSKRLRSSPLMMIMMVIMVSMVMVISIGIEGEGANKRLSVSPDSLSPQLASAKDTLTTNQEDEEELSVHIDNNNPEPVGVTTNTAQQRLPM